MQYHLSVIWLSKTLGYLVYQYLYDVLVRTPEINGPFIWLNLEMDGLADDSNINHNSVVDMRKDTLE